MDPALREYLGRMQQDNITRADSEAAQAAQRTTANIATQEGMMHQLANHFAQLRDLSEWKPDLEARLAKLQDVVADLQRARFLDAAAAGGSASGYVDASFSQPAVGEIHGPHGHRGNIYSGGMPAVNTTLLSAPPGKGTFSFQYPLSHGTNDPGTLASQIIAGLGANAPTMPFPQFTGDNPNLWQTLAEQYFQMFLIHESYWVGMSILHFSGAAGIWLQSVQKRLASLNWQSFTALLGTRFGRDRHQLLIRQFYTIKQITTQNILRDLISL